MKTVRVYDPALCCSSGVCGPSVDPELVRVNTDLEWLKTKGVEVTRFNLAQQPSEFVADEQVKTRLQRSGSEVLPLNFLNDELVAARFYPTREQWVQLCNLEVENESCCSDGGCC